MYINLYHLILKMDNELSQRNIVNSGVLETSLSDKFLVFCNRKLDGAVKRGSNAIKTLKMTNFHLKAFLANDSGVFSEHVLTETDDIDLLVSNWPNLFSLIIEKHVPMTRMHFSETYHP